MKILFSLILFLVPFSCFANTTILATDGKTYCIGSTSSQAVSGGCYLPSSFDGLWRYVWQNNTVTRSVAGSNTGVCESPRVNSYSVITAPVLDPSQCVCEKIYEWQESSSENSIGGFECKEVNCSNIFVDNALCNFAEFPLFHNGQNDPGIEDGIDCGGQSDFPCITGCPENTEPVSSGCYHTTSPDSSGNCPTGYSKTINTATGVTLSCDKRVSDITLASQEWFSLNPLDPYEAGQSYTGGTFSEVVNSTTQTTDNGDGTSTKVTVQTGTDSKGNSFTKTTNTVVDNSTGNVLGQTSTTQTDTPPEDNPENYDYGSPDGAVDGDIDGEKADKFATRLDDFLASVNSSPVANSFSALSDTSNIGEGTSSYTVSLGSWGEETINFSIFQTALNSLGYFLIFLSLWRSYRLIVANK